MTVRLHFRDSDDWVYSWVTDLDHPELDPVLDRVDRDLVVELLGDVDVSGFALPDDPKEERRRAQQLAEVLLPVGILQSEASDRRRTLVVRPSGILARLPWGLLELPDGRESWSAGECGLAFRLESALSSAP